MSRTFLSYILIGVALLGAYAFSTPSAHAQSLPTTEELTISLNPQYPRPHDPIQITVSSNIVNLIGSTVTTTLNGKVLAQNGRSAVGVVGAGGKLVTISVKVNTAGEIREKILTFTPADAILVMEPISSSHPFYQGGSLVVPEGRVRFIAMPDFRTSTGERIPKNSLVYTWKLGEQQLNDYSGIGRSVLSAIAPLKYRDEKVSVVITTQDQSIGTKISTPVVPVDPSVLIYRKNLLGGVDFAHALSGVFSLAGNEETFVAVPYNFSMTPTFSWKLNGTESDTDSTITVRTTGSTRGTASLVADLSSAIIDQYAKSSVTLDFNARSTGIFGR